MSFRTGHVLEAGKKEVTVSYGKQEDEVKSPVVSERKNSPLKKSEDSNSSFIMTESDHEPDEQITSQIITLTKEQQRRKRILDFAGINPQADTSNLPKGFSSKRSRAKLPLPIAKKKFKTEDEAKEEKLVAQYGIGYKLLKLSGYEVDKGVGKDKQKV